MSQGESRAADAPTRRKCEAHGLHYDPTRQPGCTLCRRDPATAPLTPGKATRPGQRFRLADDFRSKTLQKGYGQGLVVLLCALLVCWFALSTMSNGRRAKRIWETGVEALDAAAEGHSDPGRFSSYTFYLTISYVAVDEELHKFETHFTRQGVKEAAGLGPLTVHYIPETGEAVSSWEYESISITETFFGLLGLGLAGFGVWLVVAAHRTIARADLLSASGHITSGRITQQEEIAPRHWAFRTQRTLVVHYVQPDGSEKKFTFSLTDGAPALLDNKELVLLSNAAGDTTFPLREDGYPLDALPPIS